MDFPEYSAYFGKVPLVCPNLHSNPSISSKINGFTFNWQHISHFSYWNERYFLSKYIAKTFASLKHMQKKFTILSMMYVW